MLTLTSIQNLPLFLAQNGSQGGAGVLDRVIAVVFTIILALVAGQFGKRAESAAARA
jgi:hypothetical protein